MAVRNEVAYEIKRSVIEKPLECTGFKYEKAVAFEYTAYVRDINVICTGHRVGAQSDSCFKSPFNCLLVYRTQKM